MTRRTQTTAGALAAAVFLLGVCSTAQKEHNDVSSAGGGGLQLGEFTPRVEKTDVGFVVSVSVPGGTPSGAAVVSDDRSPATTYQFTVKR